MSSRNKTLALTRNEADTYSQSLLKLSQSASLDDIRNRILCQDLESAAPHLPTACVDLLVLDPPYNLNKNFNGASFQKRDAVDYSRLLEQWVTALLPVLKPTATVYICGDWQSSASIYSVASRHLKIRNRITWEREKGRGALSNWKNCSEDIWFCTMSDRYTFNTDAVKLKRRVMAPYRNQDDTPKDWDESDDGNFRLTFPSNLWTDITIPFWSMPENTEHPTQKPEKLIAKLVLASSNAKDVVMDPFLGSGTTAVVAQKLERSFIGIERDREYGCLALKRLKRAETDRSIQGYREEVFWERNSLASQKKARHPRAGKARPAQKDRK
jgi:site-specific DNA-methyltransferase (adenine-specific)